MKKLSCQTCLQDAPLTCQENRRFALTKLKCKHGSCGKIFAFLIAELTSQLYTVNLKLLFHYLPSTKLSLGSCYLQTHRLITAITSQSDAYTQSNKHNEFSFTGKHNEPPTHDLSLQQIDNVQYTESNQTHTKISLYHTHALYTLSPALVPHVSSHDQGPVHQVDKKLLHIT